MILMFNNCKQHLARVIIMRTPSKKRLTRTAIKPNACGRSQYVSVTIGLHHASTAMVQKGRKMT